MSNVDRSTTHPSWLSTSKAASVHVLRISHGEFVLNVTDVQGTAHYIRLSKPALRTVTLVGNLIFTDLKGAHRAEKRISNAKPTLWKRIKVAFKVLRGL